MPAEVRFGLTVEDNVVYFILTDPTWVKRFFRNAGDGIAVDVISKDQYVCNGENKFTNSSICRGVLIKPVYTDYINKNGKVIDGAFYLKIGEVPESMKGKEIETNLLILQDYYLCDYNVFIIYQVHHGVCWTWDCIWISWSIFQIKIRWKQCMNAFIKRKLNL